MTTEEKAKAYDEALKWMRELYPGLHGATKEDAEHYFPELRESEDERMMKNIRLALLSVEDVFWRTHGLTAKEAISYLEKQKEQSKWPHVGPISEEEELCLMPQEQKPAELIPDRRQIAFMIEDGRRCGVIEGRKQVLDNPETYGLQKPAAFGGKDKKIVDALILELKTNPSVATTNGYKRADYIDWLSNLGPSWKPSEEQMSMLRAVINDPNNSGAESCQIALRGIYEQLKKL